jgi:hypothetical protein
VFDAGATEDDIELAQFAGTEIISDFSAPTDIDEQILTLPHPEKIEHLQHLVYHRHEHNDPT